MSNPSEQDYRTADAMIEYFDNYEKFGNREKQKGNLKWRADKKLKQQAE